MIKFLQEKIVFCIILFALSTANAQTTTNLSLVTVKGNKFMTADGKVIVFRGLDASDPDKLSKDGHWNKEYFEMVKAGEQILSVFLYILLHGAAGEKKII